MLVLLLLVHQDFYVTGLIVALRDRYHGNANSY
jgi:hypothetical protein